MCYVVLVSAGRNVLDSVPPTRRPPTHGRLSASIPLALPARHNLFAHLNPYPAFIPLLSFSLSPSSASQELLQPNRHTDTHSASHDAPITQLMQHIKCLCCVSAGLLSNRASRLCYSGHIPGRATRKLGGHSGNQAEQLETTEERFRNISQLQNWCLCVSFVFL